MTPQQFRQYAHQVADWMADYLENIEQYPVKAQVQPDQILEQLPDMPPSHAEDFDKIIADFNDLILPGITHWQHPSFFAYFPANSSPASVLAEMLTATLAAQCMLWDTSPAAAELEERMLDWLKQLTGLPQNLHGTLYDGASTATLSAILAAREKATGFAVNRHGFTANTAVLRVYTSAEAHSSVEKAAKMAGIGQENVVKIPVDAHFRLNPKLLAEAIAADIRQDYTPLCVVATLGTTGCTAIDPLEEIAQICNQYLVWLHVDAAYAGTALLLPEYRWMLKGIEQADSFVFNPHKWLFTNFDCSAFYVKDKETLLQTFSILPEYLKTENRNRVNNYSEWSPQLGRRFRALKLWFVLRSYGVQQLQEKIRHHINLAHSLSHQIKQHPFFEIAAPVTLNLVCFRLAPPRLQQQPDALNALNEQLLQRLNQSGKMYLSHTKLNGLYTLRMVTGQTNVEKKHVESAWKLIQTHATALLQGNDE
ncbi:aminotransferase class V-fold PLP-dependent enzyme [Sphingobacteriales bacterium UPWRP_1]|nr:aspartate aminotransferase family protein [Sphingobacteriales bacterium TSM_CSM]PSJ77983.1 aminotransferase class V-fold PLP-dependent enzyme [Sphingobacteriales bacterium UPWRP_1]